MEAAYYHLASQKAEDTAWYYKTCILPAKVAVAEDKSIEDSCREFAEKINQRFKTLETNMQKKQTYWHWKNHRKEYGIMNRKQRN